MRLAIKGGLHVSSLAYQRSRTGVTNFFETASYFLCTD